MVITQNQVQKPLQIRDSTTIHRGERKYLPQIGLLSKDINWRHNLRQTGDIAHDNVREVMHYIRL